MLRWIYLLRIQPFPMLCQAVLYKERVMAMVIGYIKMGLLNYSLIIC
jgi:hypothetical protein